MQAYFTKTMSYVLTNKFDSLLDRLKIVLQTEKYLIGIANGNLYKLRLKFSHDVIIVIFFKAQYVRLQILACNGLHYNAFVFLFAYLLLTVQ